MNDNFRQRYTNRYSSRSQSRTRGSGARASPPLDKSSPKRLLNFVIAGAGGLVLGVAVGTLRELMNGSFCTKAQVERALQTACISIVPSVEKAARLQFCRAPGTHFCHVI